MRRRTRSACSSYSLGHQAGSPPEDTGRAGRAPLTWDLVSSGYSLSPPAQDDSESPWLTLATLSSSRPPGLLSLPKARPSALRELWEPASAAATHSPHCTQEGSGCSFLLIKIPSHAPLAFRMRSKFLNLPTKTLGSNQSHSPSPPHLCVCTHPGTHTP